MKIITAALFLFIGLASGAPSGFSPYIIGGDDVSITQFPYQISIQVNLLGHVHLCGGAIISPNWIITAAHCVSFTISVSRIVAGASNLTNIDENAQIRDIDLFNIIIHPEYEDALVNDLALLKLTQPFDFNDFVQPIEISKVKCISEEEPTYFTGYGLREESDAPQSLKSVNLNLVSFEECFSLLESALGSDVLLKEENHVCTVGATGPCLFDDGGPLVQDDRLIGILTWLPSICISDKVPVVFQAIGNYVSFIKEHVDDLP